MPGLPKLVLHLVWIVYCSYKVFLMTLNVITFIYIYRYVVYVAGQQSEQPKNVQLETNGKCHQFYVFWDPTLK